MTHSACSGRMGHRACVDDLYPFSVAIVMRLQRVMQVSGRVVRALFPLTARPGGRAGTPIVLPNNNHAINTKTKRRTATRVKGNVTSSGSRARPAQPTKLHSANCFGVYLGFSLPAV